MRSLLVAWAGASMLLNAYAGAQTPAPAKHPPEKPGTTATETPAGGKRRGADSTRVFLGLGPPPDAEAAAKGEKLFGQNCAFCHGMKANGGDSGPDLVRSALVLHDEKGETIGPVVHNGRPNRGMPAFASFSSDELYQIAEFLHMRIELTANRGNYKIGDVLTGNAQAGKAYFEGPGGCTACHSVSGDLAHVGTKFSPADLQQTFLYPGARGYDPGSPELTPPVTVTESSGQTITGRLNHLDDFVVTLYDNEGNFHSIERKPGVKVEVEDKLAAHRRLLDKYTDADMHNLTAYLVTFK